MHYVLSPDELAALSPLFRGKGGRRLSSLLLRWTKIDTLNYLHDKFFDLKGADFTRKAIEWCGVRYKVAGLDVLDKIGGPFITVSNHAYGGADGIVLIDFMARRFPDYKVMVNEILSRVSNLEPNFITVTPKTAASGGPTGRSVSGVKEALEHVAAGHPLGFFPSGAVSDLHLWDWLMPWRQGAEVRAVTAYGNFMRSVRDRDWQDSVIRLIRKVRVPVVPIRFFDGNSPFYYLLGVIDWRVRLLRLPRECFNKAGKELRVAVGRPVTVSEQAECKSVTELKGLLRSAVYSMPLPGSYEVFPE